MNLRLWWSNKVKKYQDWKDMKHVSCQAFLTKVHNGLTKLDTKLVSFKNWVVRGIDLIREFVNNIKTAVGILIDARRINKISKLEDKITVLNEKLGFV